MVNYKVGTPQLSLRQKVLLLVVLVLILLVVIVVVLVLIVLVPGAFNGQRQGWKAPGELEVSKSVECEIFPQCFVAIGLVTECLFTAGYHLVTSVDEEDGYVIRLVDSYRP